jgi:glutaredoxin
MIKIIGLKNCSKCTVVKGILDSKAIEYEYNILTELPEEERRKYAQMARDVNYNTMPLIIRDDKLITLQEV